MKVTQSKEDYLEAILQITKEKGYCRSVDVSKYLGYATSSVSVAVGNMVKDGLITKGNGGILILTDTGREIAETISGRHEFFRDWLIDLGVNPKVADEDACNLEHVISHESFKKIKDLVESERKTQTAASVK